MRGEKGLKIVFMGTPAVAVPVLSAVLDAGYSVVGVYTQPDRPTGRGRRIASSEVKRITAAQVREICDLRAAEASVQPFHPNDLARSGPLGQKAAPRRNPEPVENDELRGDDSALFGEPSAPKSTEPPVISFPYHARISK